MAEQGPKMLQAQFSLAPAKAAKKKPAPKKQCAHEWETIPNAPHVAKHLPPLYQRCRKCREYVWKKEG